MFTYSILHKSQSGFIQKHSCKTGLINLMNKWLKSIDNDEKVEAVFFDLRKAFDVVDHDLLIQKLFAYKFSANSLCWIKSYLSERKQCIIQK